jgi:hypothetical protein
MRQYFGSEGSDGTLLPARACAEIAGALRGLRADLQVYEQSATAVAGGVVLAARDGATRKLVVCGKVPGFVGTGSEVAGVPVLVCDADEPHMAALRERISWLRPRLTGTAPSLGLGDRLGLATPGHIASDLDSGLILVLAQQSIREMTRTERSAQQVMDEAVFGVFEAGYDRGFGSDADHLKTFADVDVTARAGFTLFTIDPSDHVDDTVDEASPAELAERFQRLISDGVPGAEEWKRVYVGRSFTAGSLTVTFDEASLVKAAVKYGRAIAHSAEMSAYITEKVPVSELELSVDETDSPTSVVEHLFIAREITGRGVKLASLAPRFVGTFEKGIDYKGDLAELEARLRDHVEIARHYGPYKISLHSGSDKLGVYPIVARVTGGLLHVKTAGTSYLEALRVVARHDLPMLREIIRFCRGRFDTDRESYHISATLDRVPEEASLADGDLERVYLDEDDGRQILHVTFGSVLTAREGGRFIFRERLFALLNREAGTYVAVLKQHIGRHIRGLMGQDTAQRSSTAA